MSSGTTSKDLVKTFALSRSAILANAQAVNERFDIRSSDRWLSSLPSFHIGGLSIYGRAFLSESEVIESTGKWNPEILVNRIKKENIQYLSLVPTQLFDLVKSQQAAPSCLKGVFIGGDFAARSLCESATALGWPLLLTFGMSELSSQIATSPFCEMKDGFLEVLPIHILKAENFGVKVQSPALFTEKIEISHSGVVRVESCDNFCLPDKVDLRSLEGRQFLKPLGRGDDVFKLSGRLFHLNDIRDELAQDFLSFDLFDKVSLGIIQDPRLGSKLEITCLRELEANQQELLEILVKKLSFPVEYFTFKFVSEFSKTSLGKIKKHQ